MTGVFTHAYDLGLSQRSGFPVFHTLIEANHVAKKEKLGAKAIGATDVDDPDFRPGGHRLAPIGTTIDGGNEFQLLRTAYGSKVRLQSLRLENGVAMAEGSADKRASLGGALNALGALTVNNSVVRRCHAINGGAIYSESKVHLMHSVLAENVADRCGGLIYTAGRPRSTAAR